MGSRTLSFLEGLAMDLNPKDIEVIMLAAKLPVNPVVVVGSKLVVMYGSHHHISYIYTTVTSVTIHANPPVHHLVLQFDGNLHGHKEAFYLTFELPRKRGDKAGWRLRTAGSSHNHAVEIPDEVFSVKVIENDLTNEPVEV